MHTFLTLENWFSHMQQDSASPKSGSMETKELYRTRFLPVAPTALYIGLHLMENSHFSAQKICLISPAFAAWVGSHQMATVLILTLGN